MKKIYLDYAAATPMDESVTEVMQVYFHKNFYNPSSTYLDGRAVNEVLQKARHDIAIQLGAKTDEIVFTAGATEANNLAIQGVMKNYLDAEVLVSSIEHESVLAPAALFAHRLIPVDKRGRVDLAKLESMITDRTVLVSVGLVNNEIGVVQPLAEISQILNRLSKTRGANSLPLLLHSDAAQAGNYLDLHVSRLGVDLLSLNGGKIYGPKQSGALYIRAGVTVQPLILGGGQERGLRSGTENVAANVGLAAALTIAQTQRLNEARRLLQIRQEFIDLIHELIPAANINQGGKHSAPHIISLTIHGCDNERLMMELDESGIQVATGSACSASSEEPSHVLAAIGLDEAAARSTIRISLGRQTTSTDIKRATQQIARLTDSQR